MKLSTEPSKGALKRQRSPSVEFAIDRKAPKIIRLSDDLPATYDREDTIAVYVPGFLEFGGLYVNKFRLVCIDEHGNEVNIPTKVQPKQQPITSQGLLSPDLPPSLPSFKGDDPSCGGVEKPPIPTPKNNSQHDSPANFALVGETKLFGFIPAQLYIYEHVTNVLHPYSDIVKMGQAGQLTLGMMFPNLRDSGWDVICLEQPILAFRQGGDSSGLRRGIYFETGIAFQGILQPVTNFLKDFFNQENPPIRLSTWLGEERHYDALMNLSNIVLRGSLPHMSVNMLDVLEVREIGIELTGTHYYDTTAGAMKWRLGYGFFGHLDLSVPSTSLLMQADYCIRKSFNSWILSVRLNDEQWNNVFGINGFALSEVVLEARLAFGKKRDTEFSFEVRASLQLWNRIFPIAGSYNKNFYSLRTYLGNLSLQDVGEIFHELIGINLDVFDYDVALNSMYLGVTPRGFELSGEVTINGLNSPRATLALSKDGIAITGSIGDLDFESVLVKNACFDVFIASRMDTDCARSSRLVIAGDVCFCSIEVKVSLYTVKSKTGDWYWTIYGEVEEDLSTSRLAPELRDSFLDISLKRLAFIASNHDEPSGSYQGLNYPVAKGIQLCAAIDGIHEIEQLMRGSVKGMILRASYVPGNRFSLSIILPSERTITFSDTVYSGPLEIEVKAGTDISLLLKGILNVKLDSQPDPLMFQLGLKADKISASAYAQMINDWVNPCSVGKNVVIRQCALEFGIVYTTFFTTGMPGVIGMAGQLQVGSKMAAVAMKVSQNPSEQLLVAQITDLGVVDLVKFASIVIDEAIPKPDNFVHFNNLELYLSTGATVGLIEYPPGVSLKGDMMIFGKHARFDCTIGTCVKIMATIESFNLGPLTVKGATVDDPIVNVEISKDKQHILIDGAVQIWDASAALHLEVGLFPTTSFDFFVDLQLSDLFLLKLQTKLTGDINLENIRSWANADFEMYGLLEQHLVDHIVSQLSTQITAAQDAVKHGFDDVKRDLEEKEAAFKACCQAAIDELEAARAVWHAKKAVVEAAFNSAHKEAARACQDLQNKVDEAERGFKGLIREKTNELERARSEAEAAIRDAQNDLDQAQRDSDNAIHEAQADLQRAKQDFENSFGSAERDIESARHDVEDLQRRVDDLDREIDDMNRRIDDAPWYDCPGLQADKVGMCMVQAGATASLQVAQGVLYAAEGVVHSVGFAAAEGAIGAAQITLEGIRTIKTEALELARGALDEVRDAQNALIETAVDALRLAETASDELQVFNLARDALRAGESVAQDLISAAQNSVDALASCVEFVAFDVAEKALKFAQENTSELNLARHAVELAAGAVNVGLDVGRWAVEHAGKIFNISKIEFSGSARSLIHADEGGPPLRAQVVGTVFGEDIEIIIVWKPDFDLVRFIKELFAMIWDKIQLLSKELLL
ncbi:hypothetical protein BX600DRAFT_376982 [Xylariales sp. PMI_506]|nr:hypothetical protein BX600DRAFT_376982 [Xylariales sp. PMI_506]